MVRLLKQEKQMALDALAQRVPPALGFVPSPGLVEARLRSLEEKGLIWRVEK